MWKNNIMINYKHFDSYKVFKCSVISNDTKNFGTMLEMRLLFIKDIYYSIMQILNAYKMILHLIAFPNIIIISKNI